MIVAVLELLWHVWVSCGATGRVLHGSVCDIVLESDKIVNFEFLV